MEMGADRPRHAMHQRHRTVGEREAGLGRGQHHRLPGGGIAWFGVGGANVGADQCHGRQRQRIRNRVGALGHICLQRMRQAIDAGVGGGSWGNGIGQLIIHQGCKGQCAEAGDQHLLIMFGVGDDGEAGAFAAGAGGRGDRYDRQSALIGCERRLVIAHFAAARRQDRHRLGGIDGGAAAETDQAVEVALFQLQHTRFDHRVGRIGDGVAEHRHREAGFHQWIEAVPDVAGADHERVGDDQRPGQAEFGHHDGDLTHGSGADQQQTGRGKIHVDFGHGLILRSCANGLARVADGLPEALKAVLDNAT